MKMKDIITLQKEPLRSDMKLFFRAFPENAEVFLHEYKEYRVFLKEGDPTDTVYVLLSGRVSARWLSPGYGMYYSYHDAPLKMFGDLAILAGVGFYSTSVRAESPSRIVSMHREDFLRWLRKDRERFEEVVRDNLQMLMLTAEHTRRMSSQDNMTRFLEYLIWNFEIHYTKGQPGIIVRKKREEMVGDIGGISLRSLNRYISDLFDEGVISLRKGKILITSEQIRIIRDKVRQSNRSIS